jgi:hypothetical protein
LNRYLHSLFSLNTHCDCAIILAQRAASKMSEIRRYHSSILNVNFGL